MKHINFFIVAIIIFSSCQLVPKDKKGAKYKAVSIDTLINSDKYLALGNSNAQLKVILKKDSSQYTDYKVVARDGNNLIIAKNLDKNIFEIHKKYIPVASFTDYKVAVYTGILKAPDFSSNPEAQLFKTRITEGCKNGINFAGHYTLIYWGCGTACQSGVVVDRKTGRIYDGYHSSLGANFKKGSRLIIFNSDAIDEHTQLIYFYESAAVRTEVWSGRGFKNLKEK